MLKRGFLNSRRQKSTTEEKCKGSRASPESHKESSSPVLSAAEVVKTLEPVDTKASSLAVTVDLADEVTNVGRKVPLPHEIVFEILTRLPVKSLSRFRCVSKLWNSTFSDRGFVKTHHIRSFTRPDGANLLVTFPEGKKDVRSIYAVRENEDPDAVHLLDLPVFIASYMSSSVNGLICLEENKVIKICNPSTREFISLPRTEQERSQMDPWTSHLHVTCFGYDPVNHQHKVLNTKFIRSRNDRMITEHRVLVLGGALSSWRLVDGPSHLPRKNDSVCLNGAIYYRAWTSVVNQRPQGTDVLVAFDVALETFRFIQLPDGASSLKDDASLSIKFDGLLAVVDYQHLKDRKTMDIWIMEDSLKPNWVRKTIVFSSAGWIDSLEEGEFFVAGAIRTGEVIISPFTLKKPFYLFYLDLKNASVRRVEIGSLPGSWLRLSGVFSGITVTDHVENILSLRGH